MSTVIEIGISTLSGDKARGLLRRLRDLNWSSGPVALTRSSHVRLQGCASLDSPVEQGVRYRVHNPQGHSALVEIQWNGSALQLMAFELNTQLPARQLQVPMICDRKGRICAKGIGARVSLENCKHRELEHFLRRVVRSLWR